MRIIRKSAKARGRQFQKRIAKEIQDIFSLEERDVVSTPASVPGVDIILSQKAKMLFPYSVECKNQETTSIWGWMKQAEQNCGKLNPLLVFTRNHSKTYVMIEWSKFLQLVKYTAAVEKWVEGEENEKED